MLPNRPENPEIRSRCRAERDPAPNFGSSRKFSVVLGVLGSSWCSRWFLKNASGVLDLDFDVDTSGQLDALQAVDGLGIRIHDVDEALVHPHLKVLAAVLVNVRTTDHRGLLRRAPSANAILYTVKPGVNRVSGSQYIRSQQYEFWADFNFSLV